MLHPMSDDRPPIVNLPTLGKRAHLLGWVRHNTTWWAALRTSDLAETGLGFKGIPVYETTFYAQPQLIEQVPDVDYSRVPRRNA